MTSSVEAPVPAWLPVLDGRAWTPLGTQAPHADPSGSLMLPDLVSGHQETFSPPRTQAEDAWARGHAQGFAEGAVGAEHVLQPAIEALAGVTAQLDASQVQFGRDRERDLEGLALAVARSLIQREMTADPTVMRDLVTRALEFLPADAAVQVRLHPADLEILLPELQALAATDRMATVKWSAEPTLERGSFMVESPHRIVDGRTDIALRTLYERLAS